MRVSVIIVFVVLCVGVYLTINFFLDRGQITPNQSNSMKFQTVSLRARSVAFGGGESIPRKFTCDGEDISPEIVIEGVSGGTKSLVLVMDDPDSPTGTWDHWLVFNIPPTVSHIEEGREPHGIRGKNSWGKTGYGGPCPGNGSHRYFFKVYALDTLLDLPEASSKRDVENAMEGHVVDYVEFFGKYEREK